MCLEEGGVEFVFFIGKKGGGGVEGCRGEGGGERKGEGVEERGVSLSVTHTNIHTHTHKHTGAEILVNEGVQDAYTHGRGSITVRAKSHIELNADNGRRKGSGKDLVVITELPFQVYKVCGM